MNTIRRAACAPANVLLSLILAFTLVPLPRAWADDDAAVDPEALPVDSTAAAAASSSSPANYFDDPSAYKDFGIDTADVPTDFNDDTSTHPLTGYKSLDPQNLFIGYVNKNESDTGMTAVADSLEYLMNSGDGLDSMLKNSIGSSHSITNDWKRFQYHANDAIPLTYNGEDLIVENTLYTGTFPDTIGGRESKQEILVRRYGSGTSPAKVAAVYNRLTSAPDQVSNIEQEGSLGLTAMAAGNFYHTDNGNQQLAVYCPAPAVPSYYPSLLIYELDENGLHLEQNIPLADMDSRFFLPSGDWRRPIVHLSTFSHDGYDDLVINVSYPRSNDFGSSSQKHDPMMFIYSTGGAPGALEKAYECEMTSGNHRMRFASALQTDLNENGVPELVVAGHCNEGYGKSDHAGRMNSKKNLVQMFTYDSSRGYQPVWDQPKEVEAIEDVYVDYEMCEPAATATGKFLRNQKNALFVEGVVFTLSTDPAATGKSEANLFRNGAFSKQFKMSLTGGRNHFIKKAVSGNFAKMNVGSEQIIVQSGAIDPVVNYRLTYDVRWIYSNNDTLVAHDTDLGYLENKDTRDNGTFLTLARCEVNKTNAYKFQLKSKSYGWSAPTPLAVLGGAPYWSELQGSDYAIGSTSFGINQTTASGSGGSWQVGGSFNVAAELLVGSGFCGTNLLGGGGFDFHGAASYIGSYTQEHEVSRSLTYTEQAGRDMVVCQATPVVVYEYDVYVPKFIVTEEYLEQYNKLAKMVDPTKAWDSSKVGQSVGDCTVPFKVISTHAPALSMLTVQKYNALCDKWRGGADRIEMKDLFPHQPGDPTTYPTNADSLPKVHEEDGAKALATSQLLEVTAEGGSVTAEASVTDSSGFTHGFELALGGGLSVSIGAETSLFGAMKGSITGGWDVDIVGGGNWTSSTATGETFSTSLPPLPKGSDSYGHSVQMAVWQTDALPSHPFVIGYLVTGTGPDSAPRSLPRWAVPYSTQGTDIVWAWSNETTRPAEQYGIATPSTQGTWNVTGSVPGTANNFTTRGAAGEEQQIRFQSYASQNGSNPSVLGPAVSGYTNGPGAPAIIAHPANLNVKQGGTATFTVEATPQAGGQVAYQWYELDTESDLYYATWKKLVGETGTTLTLENVTKKGYDKHRYRVEVLDVSAIPNQAALSNPATLRVDATSDQSDAGKLVPNIAFEVTGAPGTTVVQHGDEAFCDYGGTFDLNVKVTDADGNPCTGEIQSLTVKAYNPTTKKLEQGQAYNSAQLDANGEVLYEDNCPSDDTKNTPWRIDANEPKVFQVEATWKPADGDTTHVFTTATLFINYGTVDISRKARMLDFDVDGDKLPDLKHAVTQAMELPSPEIDMVGQTFEGWYLDEAFSTPLTHENLRNLVGDAVVFSKWSQIERTVSYELNDGQNDPDNPAVLTHDSRAVSLQPATRAGYAFEGWFLDPDFTQPIDCIPQGVLDDLTLHAKWSLVEYPIYYASFWGTNPADNPLTYTVLDEVNLEPPLFEDAVPGSNAWYADWQFTQKAETTIPAGSTGSVVLYGYAERAADPTPGPEPTPGPGPNPTVPTSGGPAHPKALVRTGDLPLPWILLVVGASAAAVVIVVGFRIRRRP